jgi:hypothetical protein
MRGRDGGDPSDGRWICRLIYDPSERQIEEDEAISRMKTDALDRLVADGTIREIDREHVGFHVGFIVRRIVQPPKRPDDLLPESAVGMG